MQVATGQMSFLASGHTLGRVGQARYGQRCDNALHSGLHLLSGFAIRILPYRLGLSCLAHNRVSDRVTRSH